MEYPVKIYRSLSLFLFLLLASVGMADPVPANFVYPLGVPFISFGLTNSPYEYVGKTYHFSTGDAVYPTDSDGMPYSHWIDKNHPSATDSSNPYGTPSKPRKTWQWNLAPGSVVRVTSGPYTLNNNSGKIWCGGDGTDGTIYFAFKDGFIDSTLALAHGTNVIIDNIIFTNTGGIRIRSDAATNAIVNVAIRGGVFKGEYRERSGGAFILGDWSNWAHRPITNIFLYSNTITGYGSWDSTNLTEYDNLGFGISGYDCFGVYIISNTVAYTGGDAVRMGGNLQGYGDSRLCWIAGNSFSYNRENALDVKYCNDLIFSQNEGWGSYTRATSAGESVVVHYGPNNIWLIGNKLHDSDYGVVTTGSTNMYVLGNEIYNIYKTTNSLDLTNTASKGSCIYAYTYYTNWILNNTMYNYDKGISLPSGANTYLTVANNIFAYRNDNVLSNGWDILDRSTTNLHVYSNNLYYPTSRFALGSTTEQSLTDIKNRGFEQNSLSSDPLIIDGTNNLRISATSPAKDAGATLNAIYDLYYSLYGASITNDLRGTNRPSFTAWDIGANEVGSTNAIAPTAVLTSPTNGSVQTTNVTFTATVSGGTGTTTQMVWSVYKTGTTNLWTNTASPWTIATNLPVGTWAVYATVLTSDGTNATSATNTFVVATWPTNSITQPANGLATTNTTQTFTAVPVNGSGTITQMVWSVDGVSIWTNTTSPWTTTGVLPLGYHTVISTITDTSPTTASATNTFSIYAITTTNAHWRNRWRR